MRKYETVVVFDGGLGESQVKDQVKKIEDAIKSQGATSVDVDKWGKKQIGPRGIKPKFGNYVCFNYSTPKYGVVESVGSLLRITDSVLKFQSHRIPDHVRKFKGNPKRKEQVLSVDEDFGDFGDLDY